MLMCGGASLGVTLVTLGKVPFTRHAKCEYKSQKSVKTRLMNNNDNEPEPEFPWKDFLKLLLPEIWYLLGAVVVSLFVYTLHVYLL